MFFSFLGSMLISPGLYEHTQMEDVRRKKKHIFSKGPLTNHGLDSLIRLIAFQIPRHVAGFRWIQSHHQENMQEEHVPRDLGSRKTQ